MRYSRTRVDVEMKVAAPRNEKLNTKASMLTIGLNNWYVVRLRRNHCSNLVEMIEIETLTAASSHKEAIRKYLVFS